MYLVGFIVGVILLHSVGDEPVSDHCLVFDNMDAGESVGFYNFSSDNSENTAATDGIVMLNPGEVPDGDSMYNPVFTQDGSKVIVPNVYTSNITVVDWASKSADTTFSVNGGPTRVACSNDYIVVSLPAEKLVEVYDIVDYSLIASHKSPYESEPWDIQISDDNKYAYISCDGVYKSDKCMKINLQNPTSTPFIMEKFVSYEKMLNVSPYNNRFYRYRNNFVVLPGGDHLAVSSSAALNFYNTSTGALDHTIPLTATSVQVALSGDGKFLICWKSSIPSALVQVDLSTFTIKSTVDLTGLSACTCRDIAVNHDGSKAFVGVEGKATYLINFTSATHKRFDTTGTPDWIVASADNSFAMCGGVYRKVSLVDFASERVVTQISGHDEIYACMSGKQNNMASMHPLLDEKIYCYSFSATSIDYDGSVLSGLSHEGDAPRRVAIAPDGSVAVITNMVSDNISILNTQTLQMDAFLDVGNRPADAAVTSDSKWAVVCVESGIKVINLDTHAIVANINTRRMGSAVAISPDDKYAYIANVWDESVSVIRLDGASSTQIKEITCLGVGMVVAGSVTPVNIAVTPNGLYCLVAGTFKDVVYVIDTSTNTIVATLPVGDQPLQIAVNHSGTRAIVTNYKSDSFSIINIDGVSSSVVCTKPVGDNPLRVAYDAVTDQFAVGLCWGSTNAVKIVDPATGEIKRTIKYPYGAVDLDYTSTGELLVLSHKADFREQAVHKFFYGTQETDLTAWPIFFDYNDKINVAVVLSPGPDLIQVLQFDTTSVVETNITVTEFPHLQIAPNPGSLHFSFTVFLPHSGEIELGVYDLSGRLIAMINEGPLPGGIHVFSWSDDIPSGVYAVRLCSNGKTVSRLITVCE